MLVPRSFLYLEEGLPGERRPQVNDHELAARSGAAGTGNDPLVNASGTLPDGYRLQSLVRTLFSSDLFRKR